jgi:hypothetical protein
VVTRQAAAIEPEGIAGEDRRPASAPRAAGTLLVRADLPQLTERRPRERLVAPVEALLRVRGRS